MKRSGIARGIYILPNLFTAASLFCGFFSIVKSINGHYQTAIILIIMAGIFDLLDGRIARLTHSESGFGLEFDSLVDLISFGLAPAVLIYVCSLSHLGRFGWLAAFLFVVCGALRLARYNVQVSNVEKKDFQGLPIPAAAGEVITFVLFHRYFYGGGEIVHPQIAFALVFMMAILMVSPVRYRSFKSMGINKRNSFYVLVAVLMIIVIIAIKPEVTMFLLNSLYVLVGVVEWLIFFRKRRRERELELAKQRKMTGTNPLAIVKDSSKKEK